MMFERLNMLMRVASLYFTRHKGLDLLEQIKASDLSDDDRDLIIHIIRRMRIIRASDVQASDSSEVPSLFYPSSASKARRQSKG